MNRSLEESTDRIAVPDGRAAASVWLAVAAIILSPVLILVPPAGVVPLALAITGIVMARRSLRRSRGSLAQIGLVASTVASVVVLAAFVGWLVLASNPDLIDSVA